MAKTAFPFRRRSTPSKPSQLSRLLFFLAFVFVSFLFCSRNATGFGFHLSSDAHCARRYRTDVSLILSSETRRRGVCSSSSVVFYFLPFSVFLLFFSHPALSIFISFSSFVCLIFFFTVSNQLVSLRQSANTLRGYCHSTKRLSLFVSCDESVRASFSGANSLHSLALPQKFPDRRNSKKKTERSRFQHLFAEITKKK